MKFSFCKISHHLSVCIPLAVAGLSLAPSIACSSEQVTASETAQSSSEPCENCESKWTWRSLWNKTRGINFGATMTQCHRMHQTRIPVVHPVCTPAFGFHNPCWRQISVDPRCQPCEQIPNQTAAQLPPPAPEPTPISDVPPSAVGPGQGS